MRRGLYAISRKGLEEGRGISLAFKVEMFEEFHSERAV